MATTDATTPFPERDGADDGPQVGLDHLTVVPENFQSDGGESTGR